MAKWNLPDTGDTKVAKVTGRITVSTIDDHDDGSATVTLDMDPETYHQIFSYGFRALVTKGLELEAAAAPCVEP